MDGEPDAHAIILLEQAGTHTVTDEPSIPSVRLESQLVQTSPKRRLSLAAMEKLSRSIRKLNTENLAGIVRLLKEYDPVRFRSNDELWIDIDKLDMELLLKLRKFVRTCKWPKRGERVNSNTSIAKPDQNLQLVTFNSSVTAERVFIDLTKEDEIPILNRPRSMIARKKNLIKNGKRVDIHIY